MVLTAAPTSFFFELNSNQKFVCCVNTMFTSNPPKDRAVMATATEMANATWEREVARYQRMEMEGRDDWNWWRDYYKRIYENGIKNIDEMVIGNWLRRSEMEVGVFVPSVHKTVIAKFAITSSGNEND